MAMLTQITGVQAGLLQPAGSQELHCQCKNQAPFSVLVAQ